MLNCSMIMKYDNAYENRKVFSYLTREYKFIFKVQQDILAFGVVFFYILNKQLCLLP